MSQYWNIEVNEIDNTTKEGNEADNGYGQISILLSHYVLKEEGKGLSTNDFTDEEKEKLESCEEGSQRNLVETISVNNQSPIEPIDKNINITVPTKVSDLVNDEGFALLTNYSHYEDFRDSYVGKAKTAFEEETDLKIGKNADADNDGIAIGENADATEGGIAIGKNAETSSTYDINIGNLAKHNVTDSIWEMKTTESASADVATANSNGTQLTDLDTVKSDLAQEILDRGQDYNSLSGMISTVSGKVTTIESYIPSETTELNQLADKNFVNSSIQTNTSNFRGNWAKWANVPTNANDYPADYTGNKKPTVNDYMVVEDASDYTDSNNVTLSGTWRFKYTGDWDTEGKNGWINEYQVNEEPLTSAQINALNSGITSTKVTNYDNHISDTSNPHSVSASQIGLGNVTNVSTESTITENSNNNITSGAVYTALASKANNDDFYAQYGFYKNASNKWTMRAASGTSYSGAVSTTTQTFGGAKTFSSSATFNAGASFASGSTTTFNGTTNFSSTSTTTFNAPPIIPVLNSTPSTLVAGMIWIS